MGSVDFSIKGSGSNQAAIDENARLKLDKLGMSAVCLCEQADIGGFPGVHRDLKRTAGWKTRDEAGHDGQASLSVHVSELLVWDYMTLDFELLNWDFAVPACREQDDVPVVVTHCMVCRRSPAVVRWRGKIESRIS